ncbi:MAG TPA: DNA repair protein RecO [Candidatus Woesebacteria bacterium]|nr:DNA repair protein RecO [Candidatus Woesebacteria bacterium]HOY60987.1 DNA repair protein RecO [Candidatus Woesebacteria bacterium]HPR99683.1 DNA repair protein RecO [Candidatus Woesebacteria bacterium]
MPKFISTEALVINKQRRREGDLIITLLTSNFGKINCLAKGVQSIKSRRLGHLEIGTIIKSSLYDKNSFYWLSETESVTAFLKDTSSLSQINLLFYFLEIVNKLLPFDQKQKELYQIVVNGVRSISQNHYSHFIKEEINFLNELGYGLPPEISTSFKKEDYKTTQGLIKKFCESIIEKPLYSHKLFH